MPVYLRTAGYKIYFWSNENGEPVHFHVTKGDPHTDDTKVWVLSNNSFMVAHNKGKISEKELSRIFSIMQSYIMDFLHFWQLYYPGQIKFYK